MLSLINILITFFIILIIYQLILEWKIVEGLENQYKEYDINNPSNILILSQQNAGNISYLKERMDGYDKTVKEVEDLSKNFVTLQQQVTDLVASQQQYADKMTGGSPPVITGAINEDVTSNKMS
jgi:hypothetical protein